MKAKWIILCIAVILIGFFITLTVKQLSTPHELNTNELELKIRDIYNAEVQTLVKEKEHFVASFNKDGSIFEVNVNAVTGQFTDLKLIHKNENKLAEEQTKPESPKENQAAENKPAAENATKPLLSKEQAVDIALKEVPGEVDSVELVKNAEGGIYFVEIEQEDDVTVQVHAITGEIIIIEFED
ncbi:PepSY domain-containing protein [Solibacillus sp. FSL W7-1464]|uniref:PepSY domain-containing protein n=1 Tax=Solibacillus sp. FSL W7-1464 TaxID=2921706 RepID=UPI0030F4E225